MTIIRTSVLRRGVFIHGVSFRTFRLYLGSNQTMVNDALHEMNSTDHRIIILFTDESYLVDDIENAEENKLSMDKWSIDGLKLGNDYKNAVLRVKKNVKNG